MNRWFLISTYALLVLWITIGITVMELHERINLRAAYRINMLACGFMECN